MQPGVSVAANQAAEVYFMRKIFKAILKPTNRRVRILVGSLLIGLLCIQITQSFATREKEVDKLVKLTEAQVVTTNASRLIKIREFAEKDHLALLKMCKAELEERNYDNYTCTFVKQERMKGKLGKEQHIDVKFMEQPRSVAMTWTKNAPVGDALVYVEDKFKNSEGKSQMVVRPQSKFLQKLTGGSVLRIPDGRDAMKNTLRPCTMFGFRNGIDSLIEVYQAARDNNECTEQFGGFTKVAGRDCIVLVRFLPQGTYVVDGEKREYPAKKTIVCIDVNNLMPLRVIGYDWEDRLSCSYEYRKVDFGANLRNEDFTPEANGIQHKAG